MRKVVSFVLLAIFVSSTILPVFAQKPRNVRSNNAHSNKDQTSFASVRAVSRGSGVLVEWTMEVETNNLGFFVYRKGKGGPEVIKGQEIVPGSAMRFGEDRFFGERYSFYDRVGTPGASYFVESVNVDGKRITSPAVTAAFTPNAKFSGETSFAASANAVNTPVGVVERRRLSVPRELSAAVKAGAHSPDSATHASVMAQSALKIAVKKEGFYRVSRLELETAGFDVSSNSANWQLYLEGVEQSIIVDPSGDYIEFYGKGTDTAETDTRMYFLIAGNSPGKRITTRAAEPNEITTVSPGYYQSFTFKQRTSYIDSVHNGPAVENYFGRVILSTVADIPITLNGIDTSGPNVTMEVRIQGFSITNHKVQFSLNNAALPQIENSFQRSYSSTYSVPPASLVNGVNSFKFRSVGTDPGGDSNFFDSVTFWYRRKYLAENNALAFYTNSQQIAKLEGFGSSNVRVFDTINEDEPVLLTNLSPYASGNSWGVDIPAGSPSVFFAVEDSGLLSPASIAATNPAQLKVPSHAADLVIISYKDFLPEAETWANYRRGQGFDVKVVEISEIFDEFSYGMMRAQAIEDFLKYAKDSWQVAPRYVLLIGDATFDPRNYENRVQYNYIPTRIVSTPYSETASDEALADFDDDGIADLAIGRIPARTSAYVTTMFNKTVAWEASLPNRLNSGAVFAYDVPNGYDFEAMSTRFRNQLPETMPVTMLPRGLPPPNQFTQAPDAHTNLINSMNTGPYFVNYAGHGATGTWATTDYFWNDHVQDLTNDGQESVYLMLTCLNGYFHNTGNVSLAETITEAANGGAVAAWASAGKTTPDAQEVIGQRFFNQLGLGQINRLGDLINDAKAALPGGPEIRLSWVLIGDPMLQTR